MSGTSLDGVHVALIETNGERVAGFGPTGYRLYSEQERDLLRRALVQGVELTDRWQRPGVLKEADDFVTSVHAGTVETFLAKEKIDKAGIAVVGFHGQTVLHRPSVRLTVQIGNGEVLAARLHMPVAYDFRAADIAVGGRAPRSFRSFIRRSRAISTARIRLRCSILAGSRTSPSSTAAIRLLATPVPAMR